MKKINISQILRNFGSNKAKTAKEEIPCFKISCFSKKEGLVYSLHFEKHGQISYKQLIAILSSLVGSVVAIIKMLSPYF